MKRIHQSDYNSHILLDVTPETAGWKYISFKVVRLGEDKTFFETNTAANEVVIVPLVGRGRLTSDNITHDLGRGDLFCERADKCLC